MLEKKTYRGIQTVFSVTSKGLNNTGILLPITVIIAMVWANSPWQEMYRSLMKMDISFAVGSFEITEPLLLWINDGFPPYYIFSLTLLVKHLKVGESRWRQTSLFP